MSSDQERIFDAFGLSEDERRFIREDEDGYQKARREADEQREAFAAWLEEKRAEFIREALAGDAE